MSFFCRQYFKEKKSAPSVVFFSLFFALSFGDILETKDGKLIEGTIADELPNAYTIRTPHGTLTIPKSSIRKVTVGSDIDNRLINLKSLYIDGKFQEALGETEQLLTFASSTDKIKISDTMISGLNIGFHKIFPTRYQAIQFNQLAGKFTENPSSLQLFSAYFLLTANEPEKAIEVLSLFSSSAIKSIGSETPSRRILDECIRHGNRLSETRVISLCRNLITYLPIGEASLSKLYTETIQQIDSLITLDRYSEAVELFTPELISLSETQFVAQAVRLIRKIKERPVLDNNTSSIFIQLEKTIVEKLPPDLKIEFYETMVQNSLINNDFTTAEKAAHKLALSHPDPGTRLIHKVSFYQKKNSVISNDPVELYKLASWAKDMHLLDEAEETFAELSQDPRVQENARVQLEIVKYLKHKNELAKLQKQYEEGKFATLKEDANNFIKKNPPRELKQRALELIQLASYHKWQTTNTGQDKAEVDYQQGERLFNQGDLDGALTLMNKIETSYESLTVLNKAKTLRQRINRIKEYDNNVKKLESESVQLKD